MQADKGYFYYQVNKYFTSTDLDLKRYGIEIATGGNILPAMASYKNFHVA